MAREKNRRGPRGEVARLLHTETHGMDIRESIVERYSEEVGCECKRRVTTLERYKKRSGLCLGDAPFGLVRVRVENPFKCRFLLGDSEGLRARARD